MACPGERFLLTASFREIDQVVVHNFYTDRAYWMTPSEAKRYCSANPLAEVINEDAGDYNYYKNLAGPKPQRRVISEEKPE